MVGMIQEYVREYVFESGASVKVCQNSTLGHGGTVWDAGLLLVAFLESQQKSMIQGRDCLELGAGTGIVSIAADALGASRSVATDLPDLVSFMKQNVGLNAGCKTECFTLDWAANDSAIHAGEFDWILCADCVYDSANVEALTRTILALAPRRGVILSNEARDAASNAAAEKQFIASMLESGFTGKGVHKDVVRPEWRCDDIHLVVFEKVINATNGG